MRLEVRHSTTYRFDPPRRGVAQSLRLWPSIFEGQRTVSWDVSIEGAVRGAGFRDGAGDWVETATLLGPVSETTISVTGVVQTEDLSGLLSGHKERVPPQAYLRTTSFTRQNTEIRALAEDAVKDVVWPLERAHALSKAIAEAITYEPGRTSPATTAGEALRTGAGVCQDHAHVLIAAATALEIPARYVTGYLHAEGAIAEASHAWAELAIDDLGWVGFDAANGVCPDARYIRIGSGFDAEDAAPIRGVTDGLGQEGLQVDVTVAEQ